MPRTALIENWQNWKAMRRSKGAGIVVKYEVEGSEQLTKIAKPSGNGAYVPVPRRWIGRAVTIILELEDRPSKSA